MYTGRRLSGSRYNILHIRLIQSSCISAYVMSSGESQMLTNASVEERLAAVEAAVIELRKQVIASQATNWLGI